MDVNELYLRRRRAERRAAAATVVTLLVVAPAFASLTYLVGWTKWGEWHSLALTLVCLATGRLAYVVVFRAVLGDPATPEEADQRLAQSAFDVAAMLGFSASAAAGMGLMELTLLIPGAYEVVELVAVPALLVMMLVWFGVASIMKPPITDLFRRLRRR